MDLLAKNTAISVKAGSNVVGNFSPYNIFCSMPQGMADAKNAEHWYLHVDPVAYQQLYSLVRSGGLDHLPSDVATFERTARKNDRIAVEAAARQLPPDDQAAFQDIYLAMCHHVAQRSAEMFNKHIEESLKGNRRAAVLEEVARTLFRMDTNEYILCGVEVQQPFAVVVPSLTQWKSDWKISNIEAVPDPHRKQSVVAIVVTYESKQLKSSKTARFHVEIRWSHGKFRQTPEAKLYKDFRWTSVEFLPSLW
jgi:regulation of enolase protein 1 (concanavalin A-like superfamily)